PSRITRSRRHHHSRSSELSHGVAREKFYLRRFTSCLNNPGAIRAPPPNSSNSAVASHLLNSFPLGCALGGQHFFGLVSSSRFPLTHFPQRTPASLLNPYSAGSFGPPPTRKSKPIISIFARLRTSPNISSSIFCSFAACAPLARVGAGLGASLRSLSPPVIPPSMKSTKPSSL